MKKINLGIIGATGSVGKSTLEIVKRFKDRFNITFLSAKSNYTLLAEYATELEVQNLVILDKDKFSELEETCNNNGVHDSRLFAGAKALNDLISIPDQMILIANNGIEALVYILQSIKHNHTIILVNKEALVSAGDIINYHLANSQAKVIPADSEHNAIYQIIQNNNNAANVTEIVLTASGGPFYHLSDDELQNVTKQAAIKHPNWSMGEFISVNSATLVNKALEIIEAHYLFDLGEDKIKALYHPQSLIHGIVKYYDGTLSMVAYKPNMQVALSYALFPNTRVNLPHMDISYSELNNITLQEINPTKMRPINLAKNALKTKGNSLCIFNVSNEVAVNSFLLGKIKFLNIMDVIEHCLNKISYNIMKDITEVYEQEKITRSVASKFINGLS